ncbi:unnamed protein product, partial [Prorocentrum cordatum]
AKLTDEVRSQVAIFLDTFLPEWIHFKVADEGTYLDAHVGPSAGNLMQLATSGSNRRPRLVAVDDASPIDANARLYQTSAITVLGHLAQFLDLPAQMRRKEFYAAHKILRMPPSTFRLKDAHALSNWMPDT